MFAKLESLEQRFAEIEQELSDPEIYANPEEYKRVSKAHAELSDVVAAYSEYKDVEEQIRGNRDLLRDSDTDIRDLAQAELEELEARRDELIERLKFLLTPKDPLDAKDILLEIRAGTGGEEAALFAADLFRMYSRFAETKGWKVELMNAHESSSGGYKEIIASISGKQVYSWLKFESGVHRVQRVPSTESQGRIHTSAVTVAILPEAEEVDVNIEPSELRIDVFRASGPGGQSVNTTDSAVRITHVPTGLVVSCQDEKSQHKNKAKAMTILRSRLLKQVEEEQKQVYDENRKNQVGSGDRSERIRTYNFPQGRVSDHRINLTLYNLSDVMEGDLYGVIEPLAQHFRAQAMQEEVEQ
ncbi:MAG: peptide chain release factor 1 [Thermodesulfobacteriota bacterium]